MLGEWHERENEFLAGWFADSAAHPFVILHDGHVARALPSSRGRRHFRRPPSSSAWPNSSSIKTLAARGVGASAAVLLFNRFAGDWEVLEDEHNQAGPAILAPHHRSANGGRFSETRGGGEVRHRFRTEARPSVSRGA